MRPVNLSLLLLRSVVGFIAMVCYFWSRVSPLATAAALLYINPILVVLLAGVLIDEEVPKGALPQRSARLLASSSSSSQAGRERQGRSWRS